MTILSILIKKKHWGKEKEVWKIYVSKVLWSFSPGDGFMGSFSFPCAFWLSTFTASSTLCHKEDHFQKDGSGTGAFVGA